MDKWAFWDVELSPYKLIIRFNVVYEQKSRTMRYDAERILVSPVRKEEFLAELASRVPSPLVILRRDTDEK